VTQVNIQKQALISHPSEMVLTQFHGASRVTRRRPFDPFGELRAGKLRAMAGQAENTEGKPFLL